RGIDVVFFNCAICHVGSVRATPESEPKFIAGMPSNTVNLRAFFEFLFNAAADRKFTPERILLAMKGAGIQEDPINRLILRYYAIHAIRDQLLDRRQRLAFITEEPEFGPGRIDTFSPAKALLNFTDMRNAPVEERIGTADFPSIWNQKPRQGMQLHWDGNNTSVEERNRSAAFGTGATPPTLDRPYIREIERWLETAQPPEWPFAIDRALAARGAPLYAKYCGECHGRNGKDFTGAHVGKVTPIEHVRTDRHRLDSYTYDLAVNQNLLYAGYGSERFSHFRKTYGYANMPLDGVWLRAPYLHNGSVPTLRSLLDDGPTRPQEFYRGDDVYDQKNVGFISDVAQRGERKFFRYVTTVPGNGNLGHDGPEYGTHLPTADKDAIVEYMKTF
ncbi:MAG TPA: cytochrome c, partial [Bryobacteraceae bacterium]|nr:cytochrome c [Bryobacteraceae bacterium]